MQAYGPEALLMPATSRHASELETYARLEFPYESSLWVAAAVGHGRERILYAERPQRPKRRPLGERLRGALRFGHAPIVGATARAERREVEAARTTQVTPLGALGNLGLPSDLPWVFQPISAAPAMGRTER